MLESRGLCGHNLFVIAVFLQLKRKVVLLTFRATRTSRILSDC